MTDSPTSKAREHSVVMGFEAMRICIHGKTQRHDPKDVLRWMRVMLKQAAHGGKVK